MDGYDWLVYQLGSILLAFGVILAIAHLHGIRREVGSDASPEPDPEPAAGQGEAREMAHSLSGNRKSWLT